MYGLELIYVRDIVGIEEFKIVQEDYDWIKIFLSVNDKFIKKCRTYKKRFYKTTLVII